MADLSSSAMQPSNMLSQYAQGGIGINPATGQPYGSNSSIQPMQQSGTQQQAPNPFSAVSQPQGFSQQGFGAIPYGMQQTQAYGPQGMQSQTGMMQPMPSQYTQPQQQQFDPNAKQNQLMRYGMGGV